jgi:hypothetical protein
MKKLSEIIERLIDRARMELWMIAPSRRDQPRTDHLSKPGALIESLSPEEHTELEKLTVDNINHRVDAAIPFIETAPGRKGRLGKHLEEQRIKYEREQLKKQHK